TAQSPAAPAGKKPAVLLHVFPSFAYGGQQSRLAALSAALGPAFKHVIVSLDGDLTAQRLFDRDGQAVFEALTLGKSVLAAPLNVWRLKRLFWRIKPDILCTYNWGSIEAALANAVGRRLAHIHYEDGFGPNESAETQPLRRLKARRALLSQAHVVVPSRALEETASKTWGVEKTRLHRIANGIDSARFRPIQKKDKARVIVGSLGALRPEKNYARLVRAFAEADRDGRAQLKIVGSGPERESLLACAKASPAKERTALPGPTKSPERCYHAFDIFALSSDTEQAPLVVMEAMAAGLPIVATNVGEIADMVSTENRAFITPIGDDDAYRDALSHLLQNPRARVVLGAANRKKAAANFGLAPMAAAHGKLFQAVLSTLPGEYA
ncbi:MAG: glycosyltransferase, partial [Hyphococcus sp.]